jgi:AcrR family transcriptional regulator
MATQGARRSEILETAAALFASSGLRTSVNEIAEACGILPGSLYHHFESKEAIIVELVQRYREDLDEIAKEALVTPHGPEELSIEERILATSKAIAACAVRHRAALLLTYYEAPSVAGDEVVQLGRVTLSAIRAAMLELLTEGQSSGVIRANIELDVLADRICHTMLHTGIGTFHRTPGATQVPEVKVEVILHGLAQKPPSRTTLDKSAALKAARQVVTMWNSLPDPDEPDRITHLRNVARTEFGRRGYEATTIRHVASAAEVSIGMVYRLIGSKDELLASIMGSYMEHVREAWDAVLQSESTPIEKIDALMWVDVNVLDRFRDEFKIQLAWMRQSPPSSRFVGSGFSTQLPEVEALLADADANGQLRALDVSSTIRCVTIIDLLWVPENIVESAGVRAAHALARDTVLYGTATRR